MRHAALVTALLLAAGLAAPAPAQPARDSAAPDADAQQNEQRPPTRDELVEQLADDDYTARENATGALLRDVTIDAAALRAMLENNDDPERHRRLMLIAEHHLMRAIIDDYEQQRRVPDAPADSAAVGFSHNPVLADLVPDSDSPGVLVLATMPGFPGYAYLKPGDIITAIDGQTPTSNTVTAVGRWVRTTIGRHRAGGEIGLTVLRGDATLEFRVTCAGIQALNELYLTGETGTAVRQAQAQEQLDDALARVTEGLPAPPAPEALTPAD